MLASDATHIMLFGGSRSGKTFLLMRTVIMRALKAPRSRHAVLRFRFNAVKASIVFDTFPKCMQLCFAGVKFNLSKTDWYAEFENGSQIWFAGLDDKERAERILGMEFVTLYLNECSQIPQGSRDIAVTRLAQQVEQVIQGKPNQPLKVHIMFPPMSYIPISRRRMSSRRDHHHIHMVHHHSTYILNSETSSRNSILNWPDTNGIVVYSY